MHLEQGNSQANIAPDVYLILDETMPAEEVKSWKMWEHGGKGPCLAVELVAEGAEEAAKDYDSASLAKYEQMGVKELVATIPREWAATVKGERRRLLTHWVRDDEGG